MPDSRTCSACGSTFTPRPGPGRPRVWCSDACRLLNMRQRAKEREKAQRRERKAGRQCVQCGADISVRSAKATYCSVRCGSMANGYQRAEPLPAAACALPECGASFQPLREGQRCCSEKHGKLLYNRESRADGRQKPPAWNDKRRDSYHRRRAQMKATSTGEPVLFAEIAERDGWHCSLCKEAVDPLVKWPDSKSPSLDHVVPLSKGGVHDPSNVALAHLGCNTAKNNRVDDEQVPLVA